MYILTGYIMLFEVKFKFVMHNCKILICIFTFKGKCITKISQNACFLVHKQQPEQWKSIIALETPVVAVVGKPT